MFWFLALTLLPFNRDCKLQKLKFKLNRLFLARVLFTLLRRSRKTIRLFLINRQLSELLRRRVVVGRWCRLVLVRRVKTVFLIWCGWFRSISQLFPLLSVTFRLGSSKPRQKLTTNRGSSMLVRLINSQSVIDRFSRLFLIRFLMTKPRPSVPTLKLLKLKLLVVLLQFSFLRLFVLTFKLLVWRRRLFRVVRRWQQLSGLRLPRQTVQTVSLVLPVTQR